jgi:hypothetical protein
MQQRLNNFFDEVVGMLDDLRKRLVPQVRSLCKTGLIPGAGRIIYFCLEDLKEAGGLPLLRLIPVRNWRKNEAWDCTLASCAWHSGILKLKGIFY